MTFFIPPVFLFGNNTNRFYNNEEKKSEYKTAAETEIKVENGNIKRIVELEEENKNLKEKQKVLDKENCKLIDENVKLKKWIYQNVHGGPRIDYQEFCKKNGI